MHKLHYRLTVSAFIEHTFCTAKIQKIIGRTFRQAVYLQNFAHFRHIVQPNVSTSLCFKQNQSNGNKPSGGRN